MQYQLNREISTQLVQYQLDVSISRHSFCAKWQLGVQTFYHLPTKPLMFYFHKRKEKGKCLEKSPILDSFGDLVDPFNYKFPWQRPKSHTVFRMVLGSDTSKEARTTTSLLSWDALYTQCYSFYGLHLHFTNFKQLQELDMVFRI